jgi:hypothetical protein
MARSGGADGVVEAGIGERGPFGEHSLKACRVELSITFQVVGAQLIDGDEDDESWIAGSLSFRREKLKYEKENEKAEKCHRGCLTQV